MFLVLAAMASVSQPAVHTQAVYGVNMSKAEGVYATGLYCTGELSLHSPLVIEIRACLDPHLHFNLTSTTSPPSSPLPSSHTHFPALLGANFSQTSCSVVNLTVDIMRPVYNTSTNVPLPGSGLLANHEREAIA